VSLSIVNAATTPPDSTCNFSNSAPTVNGNTPAQTVLIVHTQEHAAMTGLKHFPPQFPGASILGFLCLVGLVSLAWTHKRRDPPGGDRLSWQGIRLGTLSLVLALNSATVACERNVTIPSGTSSGNYVVIVQGRLSSNSAVTRQVILNVTVTQ
jgi:hypothetical protein